MKKLSFKIATLSLAFTVLFSTLAFSVNKHYCGDMLFTKAIFTHVGDCGMQQETICKENISFEQTLNNSSCCYDVQLFIKGQNLDQKALLSTSIEVKSVALIFAFKNFDFESDYKKQPSFHKNYSPPLLVKNIPVLVQSFLI